jgi:hypothetical protein
MSTDAMSRRQKALLTAEVKGLRRKANAANRERGKQGEVIHTLRLEVAALRQQLKAAKMSAIRTDPGPALSSVSK